MDALTLQFNQTLPELAAVTFLPAPSREVRQQFGTPVTQQMLPACIHAVDFFGDVLRINQGCDHFRRCEIGT